MLEERASALIPPQLAEAELQAIGAMLFPTLSTNETIQFFVLLSFFGALTAIYFCLLLVHGYRYLRGTQRLWIFQKLHRPDGALVFKHNARKG